MSQVVVVASFTAKPGSEQDLLDGLEELITATHAEAGCLAYALHRDATDARTFVLVERWTSQVALESHLQQPYVAGVAGRAQDLLAEPIQMRVTTPVVLGDPVKGSL